jgi:predicted phage terminase large subunit-like protein
VKPTRKQAEFLLEGGKEAFYGGAAGGGKSYALLMAALMYVAYPQYSALLLRRTFPELSQRNGLMDIARTWLSTTDAKPGDQGRLWTFPSGATLTFGYLENENDKYRYQGSEFQFIGYDELSQFSESQYLYLFSRLRRAVDNPVPERMRSASNPGGVGHQWVKDRFIDPVTKTDGRVYIPSKLQENPYLDRESYEANLANLDAVTRAQYLNGDWDIQAAGNFFKRQWFEVVDGCPGQARRLRYWDMAGTTDGDYTVGALVGLLNGVYYIIDIRRARETPGQVEQLIKQTAELDGRTVPVRTEEEPGSSGLAVTHHYATQVLVGWDYKGIRATGDKATRAGPFSSAAEHGNVKVLRAAWNNALLDELTLFPDGSHDDQVDAVSGAIGQLSEGDANRFLASYVGRRRR